MRISLSSPYLSTPICAHYCRNLYRNMPLWRACTTEIMQHQLDSFRMPTIFDGNLLQFFNFLPVLIVIVHITSLYSKFYNEISLFSLTGLPNSSVHNLLTSSTRSGNCRHMKLINQIHLATTFSLPTLPTFLTTHYIPLAPNEQCFKNPITQNQQTLQTSSSTLRQHLILLHKWGKMNCSYIARNLQKDSSVLQARLILWIIVSSQGLAELFVREMKKLQIVDSSRFSRKSEYVQQKQLMSLSLRVNGYMNRNKLEEQSLYLPHIQINFFNITCSFSTQSSFNKVLVSLANATRLQTSSYDQEVGVCMKFTHSIIPSIYCSVMVINYYLKNAGIVLDTRDSDYWASLELGSDYIQVENRVSYPFYKQVLYFDLQVTPQHLTFFFLLQKYRNINITKLLTSSIAFLTYATTLYSHQVRSLSSSSPRTQSRIFQAQQLQEAISSPTIFRQSFSFLTLAIQVSLCRLQFSSTDILVFFY